jgi:oxaloacetate decarboxylase gamma subunit
VVESVISEGVNVMVYGMGTVFSFLILLVFAIQLMTMATSIFSNSEEAFEHESLVQRARIDSDTIEAIRQGIDLHKKSNRS